MIDQKSDFVREVLSASVTEFFASYGVACGVANDVPETVDGSGVEIGSVIGFKGRNVRGAFAFVAPLDFIAELLPVPRERDRQDQQLRDWSAEIANQLVGRLKNKLSLRSVDFDVGSPVCFTGRSIRLVFLPDAEGVSMGFRSGSTAVRIHLDCSIDTGCADNVIEELRIVPEGDVIIF